MPTLPSLALPLSWPLAVAAAAIFVIVGELAYRAAFHWLNKFSSQTETTLDDRLVRRMRIPAQLLVFLGAAHVLLAARGVDHNVLMDTVLMVELALVAFLAIETFDTAFIHYFLGERKNVQFPTVVRHLVLVVLYTVAALSILGSVTGINLGPILATSTVVTVVLGLALQDTLGNLFSGLALHVERPFGMGDWLLVDGVEGQVVYMGWRSTRLRTFSGDVVAVPNSTIAKARVQNYSMPVALTARNLEFLVPLHAAPEDVEAAVRAACAQVPVIRADPPAKVWLVGMTPLAQRYVVKAWVDDFGQHDDAESDLYKALWHALRRAGLGLPEGTAIGVTAAGEVAAAAVLGATGPRPASMAGTNAGTNDRTPIKI